MLCRVRVVVVVLEGEVVVELVALLALESVMLLVVLLGLLLLHKLDSKNLNMLKAQ